jgi:hypothetical protein
MTTFKITKRPLNIPNGRKIFQMTRIYNNNFHSNVLQSILKLGFLVSKETIWQPSPKCAWPQTVDNPEISGAATR